MRSNSFARCFAVILLVAGIVWAMISSGSAQSGGTGRPPPSSNSDKHLPNVSDTEQNSTRRLADNSPVVVDEPGTIKLDTSLVTIPVSVIDRDGKFLPFLKKRDFRVYEDGVEQD